MPRSGQTTSTKRASPPSGASLGLPPLGSITLELTHRCHRRCAFCYVPGLAAARSRGARELSPDEIGAVAERLVRPSGCRHVQLSGGEPLLRRDLVAVVSRLREVGARVSIITDGAPLGAPLAASLVRLGVGPVQPTLLAATAGLHDRLRGRGAFRATTRAIAVAAAAGLRVIVCLVVTRLNWQQAGPVAELAFALGARGLALSRFCPAGAAAPAAATLMPTAAQIRAAARDAATACRGLGLPLAAAVTIPACVWSDPARPPLRVGVCSLVGPRSTVTVGPDGAVRSCALSTRVVGSILVEPWEEIGRRLWVEELEPLRRARIPRCQGCAHWARCLGGCRLSAAATFGAGDHPDPLAPVAAG